jgi:hypothetical protein
MNALGISVPTRLIAGRKEVMDGQRARPFQFAGPGQTVILGE